MRFDPKVHLHQRCPKCSSREPGQEHDVILATVAAGQTNTAIAASQRPAVDVLRVFCRRCSALLGEYEPMDTPEEQHV